MKIRRKISLLLLACAAVAAIAQGFVSSCRAGEARASQSEAARTKTDNAVEQEPESSDPAVQKARRLKNIRYNKGGPDLTIRRPHDGDIFFDQIWPRVEFIPASQSAVIVNGKVVKLQPYLSEDRSRIYTEITVQVEEVFKGHPGRLPFSSDTVVIDRLGGTLRLATGQVVRDKTQVDGLGITDLGKRYVFFAGRANRGSDITLLASYELKDGRVFRNRERAGELISSIPGVPTALDNEAAFLQAVRNKVRKR